MSGDGDQRAALIDRIVSAEMPNWAKTAALHSMGAPKHHPTTGAPLRSFRDVLELAADSTLETLRQDLEDNGYLPRVGTESGVLTIGEPKA